MTDRELLEKAAKAAGIDVQPHPNRRLFAALIFQYMGKNWNPLTDDGDALRLAVRLNIKVEPEVAGQSYATCHSLPSVFETINDNGGDTFAATRRAIVRAAAAIGQA